jgi:hypothetical protein
MTLNVINFGNKQSTQPEDTSVVLAYILKDFAMRLKTVNGLDLLDSLIQETVGQLMRAGQYQKQLLTEKEVSEKFPFLSIIKLRNMRSRNQGPNYHKLGEFRNSRVFYKISDVESWIVQHYRVSSLN